MLAIKFQYENKVKKIQVKENEMSWDTICEILTKSFFLAEKDKIKLTYKDSDNDEITVKGDKDLAEVSRVFFMKGLIKFFVYYSGNMISGDKNYIKIEKKSEKATESAITMKPQPEEEKFISQSQVAVQTSLTESKKEKKFLKIDPKDLGDIFMEVFSSTDLIQKLQNRITEFVDKTPIQPSEIVEYAVDTDFLHISQRMMEKVNEIVNEKYQDILTKSSPQLQTKPEKTVETQVPKEKKSEEEQKQETKSDFVNIKETKLSESLYVPKTNKVEAGTTETQKQRQKPKINAAADNSGFRFVMKYENGKAKFVAVPISEFKTEEAEAKNRKESPVESFEKVEETIDDIVVSLSRETSREQPIK